MPFDVKKANRELYAPQMGPHLILVPPMRFIAVAGRGDPNDPQGEYTRALEMLYATVYTVKMSRRSGRDIPGYEDFVVPPLEGLWWMPGLAGMDYVHKDRLHWLSMIRLPDFAGQETVDWARSEVLRRKGLDASPVHVLDYDEGLCVQCLHLGPYDAEPATLEGMLDHLRAQGCESDFSVRRHHEIYLSDPRRTAPGKLRTILRHPVRRVELVPVGGAGSR